MMHDSLSRRVVAVLASGCCLACLECSADAVADFDRAFADLLAAGAEARPEAEHRVERLVKRATPAVRGHIETALTACIRRPDASSANRQFALMTLLRIMSPEAVGLLSELLVDKDLAAMARVALTSLRLPEVDQALLEALARVPATGRPGVIEALGARRSRQAVPPLTELLGDEDRGVVRAAVAALGQIGGPDSAASLAGMDVAAELQETWAAAYIACRATLNDEERREVRFGPSVPQLLKASGSGLQQALLRALCREARVVGLEVGVAVVDLAATAEGLTAREALATVGAAAPGDAFPQAVRLLDRAWTGDDRAAAEKAVGAVAKRVDTTGPAVQCLLTLARDGSVPGRVSAVRLLAAHPEDSTLQALTSMASDPERAVRNAVIKVLGGWPDCRPSTTLLEAARSAVDAAERLAALDGVVRMAVLAAAESERQRDRMFKAALSVARGEEERQMVLQAREALQVASASVSTGKEIEVVDRGLKLGLPVYIDRPYTFVQIPGELQGGMFIRMSMDDKYVKEPEYLTFTVSKPVRVFVGYDHRAQRTPEWLDDWDKTAEAILTTDRGCRLMLFRKSFASGKVVLGPNAAPGAGAHYIVVLRD